MNPKFRAFYLLGGTAGLVLLIYQAIVTYPDIDPAIVLLITIPDMVFFYLAYQTYPADDMFEQRIAKRDYEERDYTERDYAEREY